MTISCGMYTPYEAQWGTSPSKKEICYITNLHKVTTLIINTNPSQSLHKLILCYEQVGPIAMNETYLMLFFFSAEYFRNPAMLFLATGLIKSALKDLLTISSNQNRDKDKEALFNVAS